MQLFFAELKNLARQTEFIIYNFDTSVDVKSERVWKRNSTPGIGRTRFGGTCFNCVTDHANKNKNRFDGYLIMTDGEAAQPPAGKLKRGWVLVPGGDMAFKPSRRDFVIQMKKGNDNN